LEGTPANKTPQGVLFLREHRLRAHGRVGASAILLACAIRQFGTIRFLELPRTLLKPQSEHEATTEQASRTNVSG